jgi:heme-degrading monooxygenase HmoA
VAVPAERRHDVLVRVWRYRVDPQLREEFEREYGPEGSWATLFATAAGFVETTLFRETHSPTTYLTVDRFASKQAWRQFRADNDAAYTALGERLDHLTLEQEELV